VDMTWQEELSQIPMNRESRKRVALLVQTEKLLSYEDGIDHANEEKSQ
jgi:hypothetical protein